MVRRPVYYPQEGEQNGNMQYPYQEPERQEQGAWQTPYGAETQAGALNDYSQMQNSLPQTQVISGSYEAPGPYASAGENSTYYQIPPATTHDASWFSDVSSQTQYDYNTHGQEYQAPSAPPSYSYEAGIPASFTTSYLAYQEPPAKQEDPKNAYQESLPGQGYPPAGSPYVSKDAYGYPQVAASGPEQDRGLIGAVAGAAAGGYAGHKMHHGFIGTLGGAYAGHKLEDAYKDHKKQPKPQDTPPTPILHMPNQQPPYRLQSQVPARHGNFSASSKDITLDKDHDLITSCSDIQGRRKLSAISLNTLLTNDDGHFEWMTPGSGAGNFGASARNVKLVDGGSGGRILYDWTNELRMTMVIYG